MPEINKITDVLYDGNQPYHVHYDNLPLKNILTRIDLVNAQVDINSEILRGSCGSVGTLSNRLSVSLQDDGKLIQSSVDNSLHNIGAHSDGEYDGVNYVRMTKSERDKLELIESESNYIELEIQDTISSKVVTDHISITNGLIKLRSSDSIGLKFTAPNFVSFHSIYSPETAHIHNYEITPAHQTPRLPDYKNFITTSLNTSFKEGTLKVYVNGIRLNSKSGSKVLVGDDPTVSESWVDLYVKSQDKNTGEFSLNTAISANDVIFIDFDQKLV
jgi:hypothetical protein